MFKLQSIRERGQLFLPKCSFYIGMIFSPHFKCFTTFVDYFFLCWSIYPPLLPVYNGYTERSKVSFDDFIKIFLGCLLYCNSLYNSQLSRLKFANLLRVANPPYHIAYEELFNTGFMGSLENRLFVYLFGFHGISIFCWLFNGKSIFIQINDSIEHKYIV